MLLTPSRYILFNIVGPGDGSFMLGCDSCDRWFHGSCMKIDKATGDALSKWICPPCSKGVPAQAPTSEKNAVAESDGKLPALDIVVNPPIVQQPHLDVSPHAPNPLSLWPPVGLRNGKDAIEVLGEVGESDNEDFAAPIQPQPVVRAKLDPNQAPKAASAAGSSAQNAPRPIFCQPVAPATKNVSLPPPPKPQAGSYHPAQLNAAGAKMPQRSIPTNAGAPKASNPPAAARGQFSIAQSATAAANAYRSIIPSVTASAAANHAASASSMQALPNLNIGLNGSTLSAAAVANMDALILAAGDDLAEVSASASLQTGVSLQVPVKNAPNPQQISSVNGQPYATTALPQAAPKAP